MHGAGAIAILVAASVTTGCQRGSGSLAVIGGRPVTLAAVDSMIQSQTGKPRGSVSPELAAALFESYLEEELILASSTRPTDRDLVGAERSMRVRELLSALCAPPAPPTDGEISSLLAETTPAPAAGERIYLRQILLTDQPAARAAVERLRRGEDFVALSRELSRAPNAGRGGIIGWVERGQLPPEFEAATFGLPSGGISDAVASSSGWHVFQVVERRAAGERDEAARRQEARSELAGRAANRQRRECLSRLAIEVGVEVNCSSAPFPCRNPFEVKS